ncbi:MAG: hypothetical protein KGI08_10930 [Thaumarchaeota archaeon]|nr:hypothetical protein [Nitrososphaerota archaeon]
MSRTYVEKIIKITLMQKTIMSDNLIKQLLEKSMVGSKMKFDDVYQMARKIAEAEPVHWYVIDINDNRKTNVDFIASNIIETSREFAMIQRHYW